MRPNRKDEPGQAPIISGIRQRVESIINTTKGILGLERHGARTLHNLRVRICVRLLALAGGITHNHNLGLPAAISPPTRYDRGISHLGGVLAEVPAPGLASGRQPSSSDRSSPASRPFGTPGRCPNLTAMCCLGSS